MIILIISLTDLYSWCRLVRLALFNGLVDLSHPNENTDSDEYDVEMFSNWTSFNC